MSLFSLLDAYNKRFYKAFILLKQLITIGCNVIEIISFVCFDQQKSKKGCFDHFSFNQLFMVEVTFINWSI